MIGNYFEEPMEAIDKAKQWLKGNRRPHALVGRTAKGYMLIDPYYKDGHYCQIVAKLFRQTK